MSLPFPGWGGGGGGRIYFDWCIMHSRFCFVEQYMYPRLSHIYMANLYLREKEKWISFLSPSISCSFSFFAQIAHAVASFLSNFPLFYSFVLSFYSRSCSAFSAILYMLLEAVHRVVQRMQLFTFIVREMFKTFVERGSRKKNCNE